MFSHRTRFSPRRATTLIEIVISVLLGSILILAATKLLSGGLKTSSKGSAHLTIVQATTILMSQLEEDLRRASSIVVPVAGGVENQLQLEVWEIDATTGKPATSTVYYMQNLDSSKGFSRTREYLGSKEKHIFCRGLLTKGNFTHVVIAPTNRVGLSAAFQTHSYPAGEEEFLLTRFIFCQNHASNTFAVGWNAP
ncbi:MAG: hypothetical protein WA705_10715 [Candidatus Ozemobacteraceae bacterium]